MAIEDESIHHEQPDRENQKHDDGNIELLRCMDGDGSLALDFGYLPEAVRSEFVDLG